MELGKDTVGDPVLSICKESVKHFKIMGRQSCTLHWGTATEVCLSIQHKILLIEEGKAVGALSN